MFLGVLAGLRGSVASPSRLLAHTALTPVCNLDTFNAGGDQGRGGHDPTKTLHVNAGKDLLQLALQAGSWPEGWIIPSTKTTRAAFKHTFYFIYTYRAYTGIIYTCAYIPCKVSFRGTPPLLYIATLPFGRTIPYFFVCCACFT